MKSCFILGLIASVSASVIPRACNGSSYNFTLTVDKPGSPFDGMLVQRVTEGLFLNVSNSDAFAASYFHKPKNGSERLYASFVVHAPDLTRILENWTVSIRNETAAPQSFQTVVTPPYLEVQEPSYIGDFFVTGDKASDPWNSNPHIGFRPDDGFGKGSWHACPQPWYDDGYFLYGGTAKFFNATIDKTDAFLPCTPLGNLKANLIEEKC